MSKPASSPAPLPVNLAANPVLSSWVRLSAEGHVSISPGKVEIGQGIVTALAQIAADELDVDIGRVQMVRASTAASPNEGVTSGSLSVQQSGRAVRQACAEVRQIFLAAASDRLGVGIDALAIADGTISGPGNVRTSYWELAGEISLDREATPGAVPKLSTQRMLAGSSVQRLDIPDKVFAHPRFIHDSALPEMLHGRVLRSEMSGAKLSELKEEGARAVAGLIAIARDGNFAGVVAETEDAAEAALTALRKDARWSGGETLPDENELPAFLKTQPVESTVIDNRTASASADKKRTIKRQYSRPYIAHASIAPSCAMAQWNGDRVRVWTHSQGVYLLRADLALVLKLPVENITVEHMEGAGCYGHNPADDVALDAALLAKAAGGRPGAMVARGRDDACAVRGGDGNRDRSRSRCAERNRRLAPHHLEQRSCRATGTRGAARLARGNGNRQSISADDFDQSAASQWRRRGSQRDTVVRFSVLADLVSSPHHHAGAHFRAAHAGRTGQRVCD
jgi:CO/xanthine dehydrogenase Mo-binding subunit